MTYTDIPIPNFNMARKFIIDHLSDVGLGYRVASLPDSSVTNIVDTYMENHPRGRGTKGDLLKRQYYAACYALKLQSSRSRWFTSNRDSRLHGITSGLSKTAQNIITSLPIDSSITDPKIDGRALPILLREKIITGYFSLEGKPVEIWLTDDGLVVQNDCLRLRAYNEREREKKQTIAAKNAIATIAGMDIPDDPEDAREMLGLAISLAQKAL